LERRLNRVVHFLFLSLLVLVIVLCILLAYRQLSIDYSLTLVFFNLFFISLFFQLSGSLKIKIGMLACGNIIGLMWNYFFQTVFRTGSDILGASLNVFFNMIYPILTLMWMVPFWSLSLSILPKPTNNVVCSA
jgi:hypothetical protein